MSRSIYPKVIAIVEDDEDTANVMRLILEEKGYVVRLLASIIPTQALKLRASLILMDQYLGHELGSSLCRHLKNNPYTRSIPVLLCSAVTGLADIQQSCKADAYISKPFDIDLFTNIIDSYLA